MKMRKISIVTLLVCGLFVASAQAGSLTVSQIESPYGAGAVFLDITDATYTSGTDASMSLTVTSGAVSDAGNDDDWNWRDTSDSDYSFDGGLDDKESGNTSDLELTISFGSAAAGQDFTLGLTQIVKDLSIPFGTSGSNLNEDGTPKKGNDFSWGTEADGSPVNVVSDAWASQSKLIFVKDPRAGGSAIEVRLGTFTADVDGNIVIWIGEAGIDGDMERSQLDGIIVVPEPATMLLLGLGSVVTLIRRKK